MPLLKQLRDFACVVNSIFLSLNFFGSVKMERNCVTEIVSQLEIADVIFSAGEGRTVMICDLCMLNTLVSIYCYR